MQGRIEAQDFFSCGLNGIGGKGCQRCSGFQQGFDAVADGVHGRLMPCVQQQDAGRDQLVRGQLFAGFLGCDKRRYQIVPRVLAALTDVVVQESHEALRGGHGALFGLGRPVCHVHADHGVGPFQQVIGNGLRHPQQAGDDGDGQFLAEMRQQVERSGGKSVDQIMA